MLFQTKYLERSQLHRLQVLGSPADPSFQTSAEQASSQGSKKGSPGTSAMAFEVKGVFCCCTVEGG